MAFKELSDSERNNAWHRETPARSSINVTIEMHNQYLSGHLANEISRQQIHANLAHIHTIRACGICHCVSDAAARVNIIRSSVWHVITSAYLLFRSSFLQVSLVIAGRQLRSRAPGAGVRGRRRHDSSSSARYWHTHSSGTKSCWMMLLPGKRHAFSGWEMDGIQPHTRVTTLWPAGRNLSFFWWKV